MDIYSDRKAVGELNSIYAEAVYGKPKSAGQELANREKRDDAAGAPKKMVVTRADKKANTPAYQNYKKGVKGYAAADHLKNEEYAELVASIQEKEGYKTVAAVIDYDRSKKGTDDATYDSEHGEKKKAKKERDYAAWEREKMKKDDPNWKHKKGSTSESFSSWRDDLSEVLTATQTEVDKEVKETKVKNKVVIDPEVKLEQALGGKVESIQEEECDECGSEEHTTEEHEFSVKEEILWDKVALALTELGEMNDVEFRVVGLDESELEEARRADKMGIARKKVTYDKGSETRNPNPDRGPTSSHKPEGSSLSGSIAKSRARSLGDKRRAANRKGANLAYGDREGRLSSFATKKRDSDADLGAQKAATDTGAHKDKKTGYRQNAKYGKRGDMRRPSYNPKHTANK